MAVRLYCNFCGASYTDDKEDFENHQKRHQRKQLAERVFGHIAPYNEREYIKTAIHKDTMNRRTSEYTSDYNDELLLYAWWSRSVEACNYDLKHPTLYEYIRLYRSNSPLLNGSYINMKHYKKTFELKSTDRYMYCSKSGEIVIYEDTESDEDIGRVFEVREGDTYKIVFHDDFYHISINIEDKTYIALLEEIYLEDADVNSIEKYITAADMETYNETHLENPLSEGYLAEFIKM